MLALMLETRGATVRTVGSAQDALDMMTRQRPDVLLADLGMAGEDGYSLISRWRRKEEEERLQRVAANRRDRIYKCNRPRTSAHRRLRQAHRQAGRYRDTGRHYQ